MNHNTLTTDPFARPDEAPSATPERGEKSESVFAHFAKKFGNKVLSQTDEGQKSHDAFDPFAPPAADVAPMQKESDPFAPLTPGAQAARDEFIATNTADVQKISSELEPAKIANNQQVASGEVTYREMENFIQGRADAAQTKADANLARLNQATAELAAKDAGEIPTTNPENKDPFNTAANNFAPKPTNPFDTEK